MIKHFLIKSTSFFASKTVYFVVVLHPKNKKIEMPAQISPAPIIAIPVKGLLMKIKAIPIPIPQPAHAIIETKIAQKEMITAHIEA